MGLFFIGQIMYHILEQLRQTAGRNDKIAILQSHQDDVLLRRVIKMALDPYLQFFIRKIPIYSITDVAKPDTLQSALDALSKLSDRELTGNDGIEHLKNILSSLSTHDAQVVECIIAKDLRCGVAESTANKVWDGLIPSFPVMLCSKSDEKTLKHIKYPALSQKKSDGARCTAIVKNGKVSLHSRSGRPIDVSSDLENEILNACAKDCMVDGELLVKDNNVEISRKASNGIINQALKGTISDTDKARIHFDVWDVGALECESEDGIIKVSVGSGFNDELRKSINNSWIDKIVTIKYNEKVQDRSGAYSLFLPIFVKERVDKTTSNLFGEIE